ncbi:hypothetical protein [Bradyrhizobium sp.]|jgi:hypothetical protein|uniref:hypothetical protein n=1 Tax=Bradyrhizobium sp. TaxID=376 RepID=UPI003BCF2E29
MGYLFFQHYRYGLVFGLARPSAICPPKRTWQSANSRASTAQSRSRRLRNFKRGRQPLMRADLGLNSVCDLLNAVLSSLAQSPLRESLGNYNP